MYETRTQGYQCVHVPKSDLHGMSPQQVRHYMLEVADRAQALTDANEFQDAEEGHGFTDPPTAPASGPPATALRRTSSRSAVDRVSTVSRSAAQASTGSTTPTGEEKIWGEGFWQLSGEPTEFLGITDCGYKFVIGDLGPQITATDVHASVLAFSRMHLLV